LKFLDLFETRTLTSAAAQIFLGKQILNYYIFFKCNPSNPGNPFIHGWIQFNKNSKERNISYITLL
jgi:hypothetical protein